MKNLHLLFNLKKAIQAAAYLLKQSGGKMEYLRLLKFLYLANRESLRENATLIVFDNASALPNGPILNTVYSLIRGRDSQSQTWWQYIETGNQYDVFIRTEAGGDELSIFEENILKSVYDTHCHKTTFELIEFTHELLEWKIHSSYLVPGKGKKSYPIELRDIVGVVTQESGIPDLWDRVKKKISGIEFYNKLL
jgi:uncharacterized phage-associated protein